ncbi:CHAT domain-containing protein, partial [filamentous cyanobacterium LEGE 11480]
ETAQAQSPLPAVPFELDLIKQQWQTTAISDQQFTIQNLLNTQQQERFGILHLATHASFQPGEANRSYIQFADNKLGLSELQQAFANRTDLPQLPELIVLSACRTAFGSPEAELGFAGAALQAKVKTVLASLWSVNDTGTAGLMAEFYQQLKTAPIKAEALRQAQIAMLKGEIFIKDGKLHWSGKNMQALPSDLQGLEAYDLSHPYYWSAFTLIGNPW